MASLPTEPAAVTLDAEALRRYLDGRYREIREQAREELTRPEYAPPSPEMSKEDARELIFDQMRTLAAKGLTGYGFPEQYGGGGDIGASIAAIETVAHRDLSLMTKVGVQFGLWGGAVLHLGTQRHHEAYLPQTITGELPGCFAMTETGHGSDVQSLGTTATYDPQTDEFVIDTPDAEAEKNYIGNAAKHGRIAAVFAQLIVGEERPGVHAFVVPLRDEDGNALPGVTLTDCGEKLGLKGVDNGRISFDQVRVPRDAMLNRYADVSADGVYSSPIENPGRRFFTMLGTLIQGRVCVGGSAANTAKNALTIAVRYGERRRQFGPNPDEEALLLDYRTHQRRLLPLLARSYALHFAQLETLEELHRQFQGDPAIEERDRKQLESRAAGLKALSTWHATTAIQESRECCGGAGYMAENQFARLKADSDVYTTFEGDNTVLLQLVAKSLLTDYKDQFGHMDAPNLVRFVAGQVVDTVVEKSLARQLLGALVDVVPAVDDPRDLRELPFQGELLQWREEHILAGVARRLKKGIDDGEDPFVVFNRCQDHVLATARAHVERFAFDSFRRAVEAAPDGPMHDALERLCALYALTAIEKDRAFFMEHGRLSAMRSKRVTSAVNYLCGEVRKDALTLVEAFGIPDELLGAPIAL